jgi:hypothetical protein
MPGKITGRVQVLANGQMLLNKSGAVANGIGISGKAPMERKPVMGTDGIQGFVEEPVEASCEVTITDRDDISLNDLAIIENGTIIFRRANGGKVYTLVDGTCVGNFKISGGEGETPVKFIGSYWTEGVDA